MRAKTKNMLLSIFFFVRAAHVWPNSYLILTEDLAINIAACDPHFIGQWLWLFKEYKEALVQNRLTWKMETRESESH